MVSAAMKIILSPAKKMVEDRDTFAVRSLPQFLEQTEELLDVLRTKSCQERKALWKCNDNIATLNEERLRRMELRKDLTPALLSYEGIAYQYMAPHVFSEEELAYAAEHLRILSGFYGVLRPFDGVTPYRLEMQAKLAVGGHRDLYDYWGDRLARSLLEETDVIINLASKEYSRTIQPYLPPDTAFITCVFGIRKNGKIIEQGTACKMARGEMVRFLAENQIEAPEDMKTFDRLNYRFQPGESDSRTYVFIK